MAPKFNEHGQLLVQDMPAQIPQRPPERPRFGQAPENLSKEDSLRLNDVRKELWTGGFRGMVSGLVFGYLGSMAAKTKWFAQGVGAMMGGDYAKQLSKFQNKHFMVATLSLGSIGMFAGSLTAGNNAIPYVRDIFQHNAKPTLTYEHTRADDMEEQMKESHVIRMEAIQRAKENRGLSSSTEEKVYTEEVWSSDRIR